MSAEPDSLRRALTMAILDGSGCEESTDNVLAMPEMQAIRKALRNMYERRVVDAGCNAAHEWLRALNLPPSVQAWVLEGEQ